MNRRRRCFGRPALSLGGSFLCAILATVACSSPTEPGDGFGVELSPRVPDPPRVIDTPNGPIIECVVGFLAQASGTGAATWHGVTFRYFTGFDRSAPTDSQRVDNSGWFPIWTADTISAAKPDTSWWTFSAGEPFEIEGEFAYVTPRGAAKSAKSRVACGPIATASSTGPTVRLLSITATDDTVETGDTLIIEYSATGTAGVWESGVAFAGAFSGQRGYSDGYRTSFTRTTHYVVPPGVRSGLPVLVAVYARDVAGRLADTSTAAMTIYDHQRPTVVPVFRPQQLTPGQTVTVEVTAQDNSDLRWIRWEFGTPALRRDSIEVSGTAAAATINITVQPEWSGLDFPLRVWAADSTGNLSPIVESSTTAFRFHPLVPAPAVIPDAHFPTGMGVLRYDPARGLLHVSQPNVPSLASLDVNALTTLSPIPLPIGFMQMDLSVSGDSLVGVHPDRNYLTVIDLDSRTRLDSIHLALLDTIFIIGFNEPEPHGIAIAANGKAIVQLRIPAAGYLGTISVDLASRQVALRADLPAAGVEEPFWRWMEATPARDRIVMVQRPCIRTYTAATDSFSACVSRDLAGFHSHISFDDSGARSTIAQRVFDAAFTPADSLPGHSIALADDGESALALDGSTIYRVRLSDGRILRRMQLPFFAERIIKVRGQATVLLIREYENRVSRLELGTF